jgi:hypothetical protein
VAIMVSAGWYPDPTHVHEHRYWDGNEWTEHVADGGASAIAPLAPGAAFPPPAVALGAAEPAVADMTDPAATPRRSSAKARRLVGGALVAVVLIVLAAVALRGVGGGTSHASGGGGSAKTATTTAAAASTKRTPATCTTDSTHTCAWTLCNPDGSPTTAPPKSSAGLVECASDFGDAPKIAHSATGAENDPLPLGASAPAPDDSSSAGWNVTVSSFTSVDKITDDMGSSCHADKGYEFVEITVHATWTGVGLGDISQGASEFGLDGNDQSSYVADNPPETSQDSGCTPDGFVVCPSNGLCNNDGGTSAGESVDGVVMFEIPNYVTPLTANLRDDIYWSVK